MGVRRLEVAAHELEHGAGSQRLGQDDATPCGIDTDDHLVGVVLRDELAPALTVVHAEGDEELVVVVVVEHVTHREAEPLRSIAGCPSISNTVGPSAAVIVW